MAQIKNEISDLFRISNRIEVVQNYILINFKPIDHVGSYLLSKEIGIIKLKLRWARQDNLADFCFVAHKLNDMVGYVKSVYLSVSKEHANYVIKELSSIAHDVQHIIEQSRLTIS